LAGIRSGYAALLLWCFDPNILAYAQLITADLGATAFGLTACYAFWHWCKSPDWALAILSGAIFGFALLCKTTWIIAFGVFPIVWLLSRRLFSTRTTSFKLELAQLAVILGVAVLVINSGYRFDGSFRLLRDYHFRSRTLAGIDGENRFAENVVGYVPVPFPKQFVLGIDQQKCDFESNFSSYLRGQWKHGGWWYYYLYAFLIKEPVGTVVLAGASLLAITLGLARGDSTCNGAFLALLPGLAIFIFVSSQTGFNHHFRYVSPALPFMFIGIACFLGGWHKSRPTLNRVACLLLVMSVFESLFIYPHSLSFFNASIGGPRNGHLHLWDSNIDWGQDLYFLRDWMVAHPEAQDVKVLNYGLLEPEDVGIHTGGRPPSAPPRRFMSKDTSKARPAEFGLTPGWFVVNVLALQVDNHPELEEGIRRGIPYCTYFNAFHPLDRVGYTFHVYHLTAEDVRRAESVSRASEPSSRKRE
jgi:hypothetical protein